MRTCSLALVAILLFAFSGGRAVAETTTISHPDFGVTLNLSELPWGEDQNCWRIRKNQIKPDSETGDYVRALVDDTCLGRSHILLRVQRAKGEYKKWEAQRDDALDNWWKKPLQRANITGTKTTELTVGSGQTAVVISKSWEIKPETLSRKQQRYTVHTFVTYDVGGQEFWLELFVYNAPFGRPRVTHDLLAQGVVTEILKGLLVTSP